MNAVVTGGAGFIGSALVDRLLDDGHRLTVIDNFSTGRAVNLDEAKARHGSRLTVLQADIRDVATQNCITNADPEIVFHLAAQMDVRVSVELPIFDADVNILGSLNVLEAARDCGARKLVFASSGGAIYGDDHSLLPFDESSPQRPLSPYGVSKKAFGDYLVAYRDLHQIDFVALALANVFGPRQDPHGEAGVVAIFAHKLLAGEPCPIYGTGSDTRDYVYVDDVVDAFVRGANVGSSTYNIGSGIETSTLDLYRAMAAAANVDADPLFLPERRGELRRSALDSGKADRELGWRATVSIEDGVKSVLDYTRAAG